jgi:hypothetical protein
MSVPYLWSVEWETVALAIVGLPEFGCLKNGERRAAEIRKSLLIRRSGLSCDQFRSRVRLFLVEKMIRRKHWNTGPFLIEFSKA